MPASTSTRSGAAFGISIRANPRPSSRDRSAASTSRSQRISRWSETKPTGQAEHVGDALPGERLEVVEDVRPEPRLARLRLALEGERPLADRRGVGDERGGLEQLVAVRVARVDDPRGQRVGREDDVRLAVPGDRPDAARERVDEARLGAPAADEARLGTRRRPRRRRAPRTSRSTSWRSAARARARRGDRAPSASASSTAVAMRGSQCRMPVRTGSPSSASSAARVASVTAFSGEGASESSIPSPR